MAVEAARTPAGRGRRRGLLTPKRKEALLAWAFVSPSMLGFIVFLGVPMVAGLVISLTQWNMLTPAQFVGLRNYRDLLHDHLMWVSLENTLYYAALSIPGTMIVALGLALAVNRVGAMFKAYRLFFFIPVVSPAVGISLIWKWIYNDQFGLLNWMFSWVGLGPFGWLSDPNLAMVSVAIVAIWRNMGYAMVIFLAGLQGIPQHLYEAADIDGARAWRKFWHITLPLLSPTTFFIFVISVIGSFQVFDQVYVMTQGGPGHATLVYTYYLWQTAFQYFQVGYASALAYVLFLVIFVATLIQVKVLNKRVIYEQG